MRTRAMLHPKFHSTAIDYSDKAPTRSCSRSDPQGVNNNAWHSKQKRLPFIKLPTPKTWLDLPKLLKEHSLIGILASLWFCEILLRPCAHVHQIKSKLLVLGAVNTTINDQGCQHVTGRLELMRMRLNKPAGWPTFVQSHFSVQTVEWFKKQLSHNLPTYRNGEN